MDSRRSILIVGGGTAGWLTACYLAKVFDLARHPSLSITLVESPEIGIVGVGEGAFPTIRTTLQFLGIDEYDLIRATRATFKQGIRFDNWVHAAGDRHDRFFHPFEAPLYAQDENLVSHWLAQPPETRPPFAEAVTIQHRVSEQQRGPKTIDDGAFAAPLNYAYHFDAAALARLLADRARALGVRHIEDRLAAAPLDDAGCIDHLRFDRNGELKADLYIDCTGLRAELIGGALRERFVSAKHHLFTDRALACRVPDPCRQGPLPSYTIAAAHEAGWTWDITLRDARGVGCVFASAYMDEAQAREVLAGHAGLGEAVAAEARLIAFEPGYRARQWVGNCVAVGMAGGFVEPLESTGIVMIEAAAAMIAELFPFHGAIDAPAARFNTLMAARYDNLVHFLKLHYCLSQRQEPFWRDNADPASIPDALRDMLELWRFRPPSRFDFLIDVETFAYFNYQYILYGMGFRTRPAFDASKTPGTGSDAFARIRQFGLQAASDLPSHRDLVERINGAG